MVHLPPATPRNWDRAILVAPLGSIHGRRAILVNEEGSHHDWRADSEPEYDRGALVVWVVSEEAWWRRRHLAMTPKRVRWPAAAVWIEWD